MARRGRKLGYRHSEETRQKIRTTMVLNRLQNYLLGEIDRRTGKPFHMQSSQVAGALGVLKKVLPDLKAIEYVGEVAERPSGVCSVPLTPEEWEAEFCDKTRVQ